MGEPYYEVIENLKLYCEIVSVVFTEEQSVSYTSANQLITKNLTK